MTLYACLWQSCCLDTIARVIMVHAVSVSNNNLLANNLVFFYLLWWNYQVNTKPWLCFTFQPSRSGEKQMMKYSPHPAVHKQFLVQLQILQPKDLFVGRSSQHWALILTCRFVWCSMLMSLQGLSTILHQDEPSVTLVSHSKYWNDHFMSSDNACTRYYYNFINISDVLQS